MLKHFYFPFHSNLQVSRRESRIRLKSSIYFPKEWLQGIYLLFFIEVFKKFCLFTFVFLQWRKINKIKLTSKLIKLYIRKKIGIYRSRCKWKDNIHGMYLTFYCSSYFCSKILTWFYTWYKLQYSISKWCGTYYKRILLRACNLFCNL